MTGATSQMMTTPRITRGHSPPFIRRSLAREDLYGVRACLDDEDVDYRNVFGGKCSTGVRLTFEV